MIKMIDLQADAKKYFPKAAPPRLELFRPWKIGEKLDELTTALVTEPVGAKELEWMDKIPNKSKRVSPEEREARRKQVLAIWNSGEHDTWKIPDMLVPKSTRGAVYSDLRALGIKK